MMVFEVSFEYFGTMFCDKTNIHSLFYGYSAQNCYGVCVVCSQCLKTPAAAGFICCKFGRGVRQDRNTKHDTYFLVFISVLMQG